jgi:hypothetical protein
LKQRENSSAPCVLVFIFLHFLQQTATKIEESIISIHRVTTMSNEATNDASKVPAGILGGTVQEGEIERMVEWFDVLDSAGLQYMTVSEGNTKQSNLYLFLDDQCFQINISDEATSTAALESIKSLIEGVNILRSGDNPLDCDDGTVNRLLRELLNNGVPPS